MIARVTTCNPCPYLSTSALALSRKINHQVWEANALIISADVDTVTERKTWEYISSGSVTLVEV